MHFRKLGSDYFEAFDPKEVAVLDLAFQRAWSVVKQSGDTADMNDTVAREEIAVHVIAVANGETNVLRVSNLAIERFRLEREKMRSALRPTPSIEPQLKAEPS